jgi:hypothetical protein
VNDENGKKLLIGGGLVALGAIILNQIYTSGFQAGLVASGGDPEVIGRHFRGGGFPFGLFFFLGIIGLIWWKATNGGRRGPGRFFQGRHGLFDDRQRSWSHTYPHQPQPGQAPYGAYQPEATPYYPQHDYQQAPGAAPQQPVNHGNQSVPPQPPVNYSPPSQPAPGYPQPEPGQSAPPAAPDPNKPAS